MACCLVLTGPHGHVGATQVGRRVARTVHFVIR